jgi:pSer/pThr/pTyr-binding forkhead associated (FHA) protein
MRKTGLFQTDQELCMNDRFRSLAYYLQKAAGISSADFLQLYNHPVLIWSEITDWDLKNDIRFETLKVDSEDEPPVDLVAETKSQVEDTLVIEVRKQPGSSRSEVILLGRSEDNDIIFTNKTVSSLHAYFQKTSGQDSYELVDAGSTNGVRVNDQRLSSSRGRFLTNQDHIQFGPAVRVTFLTAPGFYDFLQGLLQVKAP